MNGPIDTDVIKARYDAGEREFFDLCFDGLKLEGLNVSGADFSGSTFRGADLSGVRMISCSLRRCDFTEAVLRGSFMMRADLSDAIFRNTKHYSTDLIEATLTRTCFERAQIFGAPMAQAEADDTDFSHAKLDNCNLSNSTLRGARFREAKLHGIQLVDAVLSGVSFSKSELRIIDFGGSTSDSVDFEGAMLDRVKFRNNALKGCHFRGAHFVATQFESVDLQGLDLHAIELGDRTMFTMCNVSGVTIERNSLDCLKDHGGLTIGQLRSMKIIDGLSELRGNYSGYWQWLHLMALLIFIFPYVTHALRLYIKAGPSCSALNCATIASLFWKFVETGGIMGDQIVWGSFAIFWFSLGYNFLRFVLLAKTKTLELRAVAAGFAPNFRWMTLCGVLVYCEIVPVGERS